ncbi:MAG: putative rRNA methyltransferase, partial [Acidimicrobiia bacterium]|nr:putative rRNA methyltransferase [Acidimicrobiia bacterium]
KSPVDWPDDATRLSYPDWIVARLRNELGDLDAFAALETMNEAPPVTQRADGYY